MPLQSTSLVACVMRRAARLHPKELWQPAVLDGNLTSFAISCAASVAFVVTSYMCALLRSSHYAIPKPKNDLIWRSVLN